MVKCPRREALLKVNLLRVVFEVISAIVDPSFRQVSQGKGKFVKAHQLRGR
jgi:hypothetical protein